MDSAGIFSEDGLGCGDSVVCTPAERIRGACPEGWHLPDSLEWNTLIDIVGGPYEAATVLKSAEGWKDVYYGAENCSGTDDYGFTVLPVKYAVGVPTNYTFYWSIGSDAGLWTSSEVDSLNVTYFTLNGGSELAKLVRGTYRTKRNALPIRCVMD